MTADKENGNEARSEKDTDRKAAGVHSPEEARQGEIVLKGPIQRWTFLGGIIAAIAVAAVIAFYLV